MTRHIKNMLLLLMMMPLVTMAFIGCPTEVTPTPKGSLTIVFESELESRTLTPALSMDIASYKISGVHNATAEVFGPVEITGNPTSSTIENISVGLWTITVEAYNAAAVKIGEGTTAATVTVGPARTATITIVALDGTGTFTFVVDLSNNELADPQIVASLLPDEQTTPQLIGESNITWNNDGNIATISVPNLAVGYYDFDFHIVDGENTYPGEYHSVRIVSGEDTAGAYEMPLFTGNLLAVVTADMNNPFEVDILSEDFALELISQQTFSATPNDDSVASYTWFVDGLRVDGETSSDISLSGGAYGFGPHNLSVKVKKTTGEVASTTIRFVVDSYGGFVSITFTDPDDANNVRNYFLESGPSVDPVAAMFVSVDEYDIPTHAYLPGIPPEMTSGAGSFIIASSEPVRVDLNEDVALLPIGDFEPITTLSLYTVGDVGPESLDQTYSATMFSLHDFDARYEYICYYVNPATEEEPAKGNLSVTFTGYDDLGAGSFVAGTFTGQAQSWITTDSLIADQQPKPYNVTGEFVVLRSHSVIPLVQ